MIADGWSTLARLLGHCAEGMSENVLFLSHTRAHTTKPNSHIPGARFTEGLAVLDRVACHAFQPAQLLRLWPQRMASWLPLLEALDRATRHGDPGDVMGADPPDAGLPSPFAATGGGWQGLPVLEDGRDAKRARRGVEQEQLREAVEAFVPYFFRVWRQELGASCEGDSARPWLCMLYSMSF